MLNQDKKYAIRALIDIAQLPFVSTASTAEIAERQALADELLDKVLIRLRNSGIPSSKSRQADIFTLSRPASEIKLGDVLRALEPSIASVSCTGSMVTGSCTDCRTPLECQIRLAIAHVRDNITTMLDETSLEALASAPPISTMSFFVPPSYQDPTDGG